MAGDLDVLEAVLLGLIQGVTEWLPVSSSGHLVLAQQFGNIQGTVFLDLLLHVGTLAVILVFYRSTVRDIAERLWSAPQAHKDGASWGTVWWQDEDRRLALLVLIGSVPTAVIGFGFEETFVALFDSTLAVGIALLATGTWLFVSRFAPEEGVGKPGLAAALLLGFAQGIAIVPGVSRSGATIGAALLLGIERAEAVRFSFLLSVPAIAGAALFQAEGEALAIAGASWPAYAVGIGVATGVGYGALWLLEHIVQRRGFHRFAWYCWPLGGLVVWLSLV